MAQFEIQAHDGTGGTAGSLYGGRCYVTLTGATFNAIQFMDDAAFLAFAELVKTTAQAILSRQEEEVSAKA